MNWLTAGPPDKHQSHQKEQGGVGTRRGEQMPSFGSNFSATRGNAASVSTDASCHKII